MTDKPEALWIKLIGVAIVLVFFVLPVVGFWYYAATAGGLATLLGICMIIWIAYLVKQKPSDEAVIACVAVQWFLGCYLDMLLQQ